MSMADTKTMMRTLESSALFTVASTFATTLEEELEIPMRCYDATTGRQLSTYRVAGPDEPSTLAPKAVQELAEIGRAQVTRKEGGLYQLVVVLFDESHPTIVAVGALPALALSESAAAQEEARLRKWLQSISDRLRLQGQFQAWRQAQEGQEAQIAQLWEALFNLNHVARRVRIHKEPEKNRKRILEAAHAASGAEALAWVPDDPDAAVSLFGEAVATPADLRRLVALLDLVEPASPGKPLTCNEDQSHHWSSQVPQIKNFVALEIRDNDRLGWVLALNKQSRAGNAGAVPFRRRDAALLTPFVALLELQSRGNRRYQDVQDLLVGLTRSLTSVMDANDTYTLGHSERVARIALELGRELGLQDDELSDTYLAGLLHDIGKIGIRDSVLKKPDELTLEEREHVKQHVVIGYHILSDLRPIRSLLAGVLHHHEHYDGTGYPNGLAGENIPLLARILAVADAFDAMTTRRPYREAMSFKEAEENLVNGAGTQWDTRVIDAFMRRRSKIYAIRQRGVGESLRHALDGLLRTQESIAEVSGCN